MRDHNFTSPAKRLAPLIKGKLATSFLEAVLADRMSEEEAGRFQCEATGTQWALLTCV